MNARLKIEKSERASLNSFLASILAQRLVDAILVPTEASSNLSAFPTLITQPERLSIANPLASVMPLNSALVISNLTLVTPSKKKIAAVLKPCEMRALIELVKLKQANLENIITIGIDCFGTYSVEDYKAMVERNENPTERLLSQARKGLEEEKLRSACKYCEYPTSLNTDITIGFFGLNGKELLVKANSDVGARLLEKSGLNLDGEALLKQREEALSKELEARNKKVERFLEETRREIAGLTNLINIFSTCISCRNCKSVCPICYCKECFFESTAFEYPSDKYLRKAESKGIVKLPLDILMFHLGRMAHMAVSCVACGMCEQACPSGIPLLKIFKLVGTNAQREFEYIPGRSLEEPLPLVMFKEEEFEQLG
ncbi:MAG: Coenzyme F420 hydrogenase/dehydrogenase, beta subunit C-terminal domain [Halobacteria archaeon]